MDLADKIRKIEALIASTSSGEERRAAELAKQRLQEKTLSQSIEYSIRTDSHRKRYSIDGVCENCFLVVTHFHRKNAFIESLFFLLGGVYV